MRLLKETDEKSVNAIPGDIARTAMCVPRTSSFQAAPHRHNDIFASSAPRVYYIWFYAFKSKLKLCAYADICPRICAQDLHGHNNKTQN